MKIKFLLFVTLFVACVSNYAQSYNTEHTTLARFLTRMYNSAPFEGVKVINDYDNNYLISVVVLNPAKYRNNESTMSRVAGVKAMSQASRFFSGSKITSELIITTREDSTQNTTTEMLEKINEQSIGYVNALSELANFSDNQGQQIFVYYKQLDALAKTKDKKKK